jgi:hypothetical protein
MEILKMDLIGNDAIITTTSSESFSASLFNIEYANSSTIEEINYILVIENVSLSGFGGLNGTLVLLFKLLVS